MKKLNFSRKKSAKHGKNPKINVDLLYWAIIWHIPAVTLQYNKENERKKMATTHKISSTDLIMANLSWNGRTMASIAKSNFTSIDDVVRLITTMAGKCVGLAKLTIRNKTQGWAINMGISTASSMSIKNLMKPMLPQKGTQLSIPF